MKILIFLLFFGFFTKCQKLVMRLPACRVPFFLGPSEEVGAKNPSFFLAWIEECRTMGANPAAKVCCKIVTGACHFRYPVLRHVDWLGFLIFVFSPGLPGLRNRRLS